MISFYKTSEVSCSERFISSTSPSVLGARGVLGFGL